MINHLGLIRPLVNGAVLNEFRGHKVTIIGVVPNSPSGKRFEMRTSDQQTVICMLRDPIDYLLNGIVEVHGESQGNNTILCDLVLCHKTDGNESGLDLVMYNEVVSMLNSLPDFWSNDVDGLNTNAY